MKRFISALLVALLIPSMMAPSASAGKARKQESNVVWQPLGKGTEVWIFGDQIYAYECVPRPTKATFYLRGADGWVEAARASSVLNRRLCTNKSAPYVVKYQFKLTVDGQQDFPMPGTHAKLLVYGITNSQGSRQATAAVYQNVNDLSEDQLDGKLPGGAVSTESDQQVQTLATPDSAQPRTSKAPLIPSPSSTIAIDRWDGCFFDGVAMYGRVKFVSVGARFKIRLVGTNAALRVKGVKHPADRCGEWQFVSANPAFTIQIVREGEDFTVSLGAKQPGVAK